MPGKIKNRDGLLSHGDVESRRVALDITEKVLRRLDSRERIKSIMRLDGDILTIGAKSWDLTKKKRIYLLGAGKACNHMAMAVDEILGDRLIRGLAIVKLSEAADSFRRTDVYVGGHPLPNQEGYRACLEMLKIVDQAGPGDLFIVLISGGSSALMSCPIEGISLDEEIAVTDVMLKSGADIFEINAIRRHISRLNGGMLAKRVEERGAELIGLGISDGIGSPATGDIGVPYAKYRGTPMGPDQTTLDEARRVIRDYGVADRLPKRVVEYLMRAGPERETPKAFPNNTYYLINTIPDSCIYAKEVSEAMGVPALILSSFLEGESREVGKVFASIAREIQAYANPLPAPCVILASGEATTAISDNSSIKGHGGPSQEETLAFAIAAGKTSGACLLSIDSEGTDGTTPAAGGLTDSRSLQAARAGGVDVYRALREHASHEALNRIGDTVLTGNTGTNLCDFNLMYVPKP
ncbi:MAG: DUF4147 domain-containing protein [Planctomycetota bacterium]|jgi:glycerate-2-kinase|nr:DUF4147 domain-containing protein [Planctomycetota bacterium]